MTENPPGARLTFYLVVLAIAAWGTYLAIGAFQQRPSRGAVVALCFLAFLGFWWAMLALRKRRLEAEKRSDDERS